MPLRGRRTRPNFGIWVKLTLGAIQPTYISPDLQCYSSQPLRDIKWPVSAERYAASITSSVFLASVAGTFGDVRWIKQSRIRSSQKEAIPTDQSRELRLCCRKQVFAYSADLRNDWSAFHVTDTISISSTSRLFLPGPFGIDCQSKSSVENRLEEPATGYRELRHKAPLLAAQGPRYPCDCAQSE
jgi:hypothetical protein